MSAALLYLVFACFYVIACPVSIRNHTTGHQKFLSGKNDGSFLSGHAYKFKFFSRPRLILNKKTTLSITPFIQDETIKYTVCTQAGNSLALASSVSKFQASVDHHLLFCRWQV